MTKREKILLQILVCVTVVGVITVYLLLPAIKEYIKLNAQYDETSELHTDMEMVLNTEGIEEGKNEADKKANEIYKFFNGKLNSYNINDMIDEMVVKNNLEITSLSIGKYIELADDELVKTAVDEEEMYDDFDDFEEYEEEENYLLGCDITFNVMGRYDDILCLIEDLNRSSQCIIIKNCTYTKTNAYVGEVSEEDDSTFLTASIQMTLYGVKPYEIGGDR